MKAGDIFSADADELGNLWEKFINDPERKREEREERRKKDEWERQCRDVESRPQSGPEAPTDEELLNLIGKGFDLFCEIPFGNDYDHLIKRLSFTHSTLEADDAGKLKTAWTMFLKEADIAFDELILSEGVAGWYEECEMYAHAIAVYEHLYTLVRRGELGRDHFDQRLDSSERSLLEIWLGSLVSLYYYRLKQPERARHFCELIEDYADDGYVSPVGSAEAISWRDELSRAAVNPRYQADLDATQNRLRHECGSLFDDLHNRTKEFVVGAELWSDKHWIKINPRSVPLRWALSIESEFHYQVFRPKRAYIEKLLGDDAPRRNQICGLGQIITVLEKAGSNVGLSYILATRRNSEFLTSGDTFAKLNVVRNDRNRVAHASERNAYTLAECRDFVEKIRKTKWVFKFLYALQPRNRSTRN
ncbi:MAG: hypothetical protein OXF97_03125 [Nitrospira sp.]|nr:hypothetical protein [Nitrospira sp.]